MSTLSSRSDDASDADGFDELSDVGGGSDQDFDREDELAFNAFFRENDTKLRNWLRSHRTPPDLVDEIALFSFMTVRRNWRRASIVNTAGYLTTVAKNRRKERIGPYLAKLAKEERAAIAELEQTLSASSDSITLSLKMTGHLNNLSPRRRQAVVLRHLRGFDVKETAKIMDVSEGSVKRYTHEGLNALGQAITQTEPGEFKDEDEEGDR